MCAMASSSESTTLTLKIGARYSALQSSSVAGFKAPPKSFIMRSSPRISTPSELKRTAKLGMTSRKRAACTSKVSMVLQVP